MGEILLLRLEGPLQSWGGRARWDVRDTGRIPTKSGIVGLLGCALGYPMGDPRLETELGAGLRFGVRTEAPGRILEDYHTVSGFLPTAGGAYRHSGIKTGTSLDKLRSDPDVEPATIVSTRFYLEDAAFLVGLEETGRAPGVLARCADALRHPAWPLFLGRKACIPSRPVFETLTSEYSDLEDAFNKHKWSYLGARGILRERLRPADAAVMLEVDSSVTGPGVASRPEAVRTNSARQFGFVNLRQARSLLASESLPPDNGGETAIPGGLP